ncbi:hypothetical protein Hanom_Chr08g00755241 [Helianthus anomalus]
MGTKGGSYKGYGKATARASFSAVVLIFRISIEIFYIYYVWPGLGWVFLVPVSFGSGTFNMQDPPLIGTIIISLQYSLNLFWSFVYHLVLCIKYSYILSFQSYNRNMRCLIYLFYYHFNHTIEI